jgi:SpoVK/Ycf46/Vps4 family AAA+-type ATPase
LKIHLKTKYMSKDIDIAAIAKRTDGFSGADLANLASEASALGLEKALETKKPQPITQEDIEAVLSEIKPSVSGKTLKMYDKLRKEYERKGKKPTEKGPAVPDVDESVVKWEE